MVGLMIALPPGCTVTHAVWINIDQLTDEMVEWYAMIGGKVFKDTWQDKHGREQSVNYVSYGQGKRCHHHQNGTGGTKLHFHGNDASTASVFIMKFFEHITDNNLTEQMARVARDTA